MEDLRGDAREYLIHRIDGLEKLLAGAGVDLDLIHRIDGLEITANVDRMSKRLIHRIDGLEILRSGACC